MDDGHEYGLNVGYGPPHLPKVSVNNVNFTQSRIVGKYVDEDDDDDDEAEDEDEEEHGATNVGDNELNETNDDGNQYDEDLNDDEDNNDDDEDDGNLQRHPKKRKLKSLLSSYEFAPRVPFPTSAPKPSFGGRNTLTDWSEHETFVLLNAWGDRFLKCGKKSLRSDEWLEVAERVSQESEIERTDSQCRNRLDTLKKKYKKEKASLNQSKTRNPKWVYFKKMDMLLSSLVKKNGVEDSCHTSGNSYSRDADDDENNDDDYDDDYDDDDDDDDDDDVDLLPPKKSKVENSFKLLADSINKFSEIYAKIENRKIEQMKELEKMKMEFHKDLELQKRQILDKAQAEIKKVQGDDED